MSTLTPPVQLEHPENQFRVDYMQDVASQHNFEYTTVSNILVYFQYLKFNTHNVILFVFKYFYFRSFMNTQKYCGKIEVYSLALKDPTNINLLTVQNSKYFSLYLYE